MAIIRNPLSPQNLIELTQAVNKITPQYGALLNSGLLNVSSTSQDSLIYEVNETDSTLIPTISRRSRETIKNAPQTNNYVTLRIPYWHHSDFITREDIAGIAVGIGQVSEESYNDVYLSKLTGLRLNAEQSKEHMVVNMIKGVTIDANGLVIADMFKETGTTQNVVTWNLSDVDFDVLSAINALKRSVTRANKLGGVITSLDVLMHPDFFNALVTHPTIVEAYRNAMVGRGILGSVPNTDQVLNQYGISDIFTYNGVRFMTYPVLFKKMDGSTEEAVEENTAYTIVRGISGLYNVIYAPSNKLSQVGTQGQPFYAWQNRSTDDYSVELETEFAGLFWMKAPELSFKIVKA